MRFLLACALLVVMSVNVELVTPRRKTKGVNVASAFVAANITNFTIPQGYLGALKRINVASTFKAAGITNFTVPQDFLQVIFGQYTRVNLGNEIYPGKTGNVPTIRYNACPDCYFTLVILDIDFPSAPNPYLSPSLRAIWVNIVNSDLQSADVVSRYVPPTPTPGTGVHRILYYYFKQAGVVDAESISFLNFVVALFDLKGFAQANNLRLEAGNFYRARFPDDLEVACIQDICKYETRNK